MSTSDRPLKRLVIYAKPHRRRILLASSFSVLNKIFDLAPPALIGMAVDVVVERDQSLLARLGVEDLMTQLVVLGVLTVVIWGFESIFEYLYGWLWRNLAQTIQHEIRLDTYSHVQNLEMAWFQDRSTGRLMAILNDDVNQLERFLDGGANDLLQVGTTAIIISAAFFWLSPVVASLAMLPIPLILWGSFAFQKRIQPRYADVRERASLVNGQLANNLSGIETIKSFTTEDKEVSRLTALSNEYRMSNQGAIRLSAAFSPLIRMLVVVGFTATLIYGGWLTLEGLLSVGSYSVLVFLTQRLLWPLTRLGQTFDLYQRAMASTSRILNLLDTPIQIISGSSALNPKEVQGNIRFENVSFSYPDREPLFQNLNLDIPGGKTLAVVGPTGSGKSTIVRLMLRFYDPNEGRILLDGTDIRDLSLSGLRTSIGLVSQSVFLFSGSVEENIAYGLERPSETDLEEAASAAEAQDFIRELPQGYQTRIGERGQKLSGGQQQRISIARAILKDPPILILDEATSAVDNETEAAIQRSLARVSVGRTTLVIAHRLSTIRNADHIIVLDEGQLVEQGTHTSLLEKDGLYARLWQVQTGQQQLLDV